MEPKSTNNNPTTVGGVTFGGGLNNNPAPAPQPADAEQTPSEPKDQLESQMPFQTPASPSADQPADQSAASDPASIDPAAELAKDPIVPQANTLNVPFVSPTSFDSANTVRPVVKDPSLPNIPQPITPAKSSKTETPEQTIKKFTTLSIVFGILAAIFLIAGVFGLVFGLTKADELSNTQTKLKTAQNIIRTVEESTGVSNITKPEDVPVYVATTGYIYISEWNIKIKIPDNLESVSYILNQNYRPSICFNAVQKGVQYFPDFANIVLNPGRMGCLTRIATSEGSFDAASGLSFGNLVFTYKDFNYFYTGSTDYSNPETDAANLGLEHTAVQIIKNMLTDNIEPYE